MPEPPPVLSVFRMNAGYGKVRVLWDVSVSVGAGEIVAVIGPNGAGKSTLLAAVMGLTRKESAGGGPVVHHENQRLDALATEEIVRRGITLVPEGAGVFPEMSCRDNLLLGAWVVKDPKAIEKRMEEVYALFPRLRERHRQSAKTLSGGERQMLAMGRALMSGPRFLLLDEPSLGLHPLMVSRIFETIRTINESGVTVLLVEQKVTFALKTCHRAYVLENGRIVLSGEGPELLGNDHVRKAYLSVSEKTPA
jgi:branched-chain amino acid transport system ATP-binding protein